jgi:hypothetical protein
MIGGVSFTTIGLSGLKCDVSRLRYSPRILAPPLHTHRTNLGVGMGRKATPRVSLRILKSIKSNIGIVCSSKPANLDAIATI